MSVPWKSSSSELSVNFSPRCPSLRKSTLPLTGTINNQKFMYEQASTCAKRESKQAQYRTKMAIDRVASVDDRPSYCQECGSAKIWIADRYSHVTFDLKFTRRDAARSTCEFRYHTYKCGNCGVHTTPFKANSKYGYNLRCYVIHLLIEMRLSHEKISEHVSAIFKLPMNRSIVADIKRDMARNYAETYQSILTHIRSGSLINADETKGVVYGGGHYVWILANLTSVYYMYSPTREASVLHGLLGEFSGVLVSDFYGGYNSVNCPQQKCLIHLMRDINEDLRKNPFNGELICIAAKFGTLLRDIVSTIDRYGLKRFHLAKHKKQGSCFIEEVAVLGCVSEPAVGLL